MPAETVLTFQLDKPVKIIKAQRSCRNSWWDLLGKRKHQG